MTTKLISVIGQAKHPEDVKVSCGCIFGNIGTGKTHLICSAVEYFDPEKVLIATLDQSDETLAKFPTLNMIDLLSLVDPNKENRSITDIMKMLVRDMRGVQKGQYHFFAFDSMSKLVSLILTELRADMGSSKAESDYNDINSLQMYGIAQNRVVEWFWELKRICVAREIHFWVVAWEAKGEWRVDDEYPNGHNYYSPQMPPALSAVIRQDWSFQGWMEIISKGGKNIPRITFSSPHIEAKNRVGFPNKVESPSVGELLKGRYSKEGETKSNVEEPET